MPQQVMAVYEIPQHAEFKYSGAMVLALDNIQNPGNLGTIIRLAVLVRHNHDFDSLPVALSTLLTLKSYKRQWELSPG